MLIVIGPLNQNIPVKNVRAVGTVGAIALPIFLEIQKEIAFNTPNTSRLED